MKHKIAVIDDEKHIVGALTQLLEPRNYDVVSANDGLSGLELIKSEKPDLVVLDINLPKKDGRDILIAMRKEQSTKGIPVIMLTGRGEDFEMEYGKELGANSYFVKPYNSSRLLSEINILIG